MNNDDIQTVTNEDWYCQSQQRRRKVFHASAGGNSTSKIIVIIITIVVIIGKVVNVVGMSTVLRTNTLGGCCYRRILFQHHSSSALSATTRSRISCLTGNRSRSTLNTCFSSSSPFWPRTPLSSSASSSSSSSSSTILRMASRCRSSGEIGDSESTAQKLSSKNLITVEECLEQYNNRHFDNDDDNDNTSTSSIQFIDATWFHKGIRNGRKEFEDGPRLPGAVHWDISDLSTNGELFPNDNPKHLRNVFPPQWLVGAALEKMGIINNNNNNNNNKSTTTKTTMLVVYGREGTLFTPRVWYTLKKYYCGSGSVKLLQGSLEEWIAKGGPADFNPIKISTNTATIIDNEDDNEGNSRGSSSSSSSSSNRNDNNNVEPATTAVTIRAKDLLEESGHRWRDSNRYKHPSISWSTAKNRLVDMQFVLDFLDYKQHQQQGKEESSSPSSSSPATTVTTTNSSNDKWPSVIIDTRGSSFSKKGHIPGSIHIPYSSLTMKDDPLKLKSKIELKKVIRDALLGGEVDNDNDDDDDNDSFLFEILRHRPPLLTCGTGVSVCTMALALEELGLPEPYIYDGSWNEWGQDPSTPKTGVSE
ncbi:MAG: 3-mercaptopyruvate sulfurtransferase SseA [Bacillariaceae sp.]|jgi:3-mercaptopyruvate sulfurtransferase SseA